MMKRNTYVRLLAMLMAVMLACTGCASSGSPVETEIPTETTQPLETTPPTTEATLPVIEGVPPETVEKFYLMHQRMEEGTLRMRIYNFYSIGWVTVHYMSMDELLGEDLSGFDDVDPIIVENEQLQEYRDLVFALQPQMLRRIPDLVECPHSCPTGATRVNGSSFCVHEFIDLACVFETEEDGVILKIGANGRTTELWFSDNFGCEYSWSVDNCFYYNDVAFYEVIRPFLPEEQREAWDRSFLD